MSLLDALAFPPFSINGPLLDSLLLEPDMNEFYITVEGDDGTGDGSIGNPFVANMPGTLDALLRSFGENSTIHLGAGEFFTYGYPDTGTRGFHIKRGWRIVGAGVDVTTVVLIQESGSEQDTLFVAFGMADGATADGFEICQLTIDANLAGFVSPSNVATGAIKGYGRGVRIHDVKAINFGTSSSEQKCMVISTAGAFPDKTEPFDCVLEDCVLEQPFRSSVRETECLVLVGAERSTDGVPAYHKGCVVRNCYVDCYYTAKEMRIRSISFVGTTATAEAIRDHGLTNNEWVVLSGAFEEGLPSTRFNGSFQVTVVNAYTFSFTLPSTPSYAPTGDMMIGRIPSQRVAIDTITVSGTGPYTVVIRTKTPHFRIPGEVVVLNNIIGGDPGFNWNTHFTIADLTSPSDSYKFRFTVTQNPGTPDPTNGYIGVDYYGVVPNGGVGVTIEGNRMLGPTFGILHAQGTTKDAVIRDNYIYGVLAGIYAKLGQVSQVASPPNANQQPDRAGASLSAVGNVATFGTVDPHGLSKGDSVVVGSASVAAYHGAWKIDSVPSPKQFKYTTATTPSGSATGMKFGALWRLGRWLIQDNIIELIGTITSNYDPPVAIRFARTPSSPAASQSPYVFEQVFIISNVIRLVEEAFDSSLVPMAIKIQNCEKGIIEENVISLLQSKPIEFDSCGTLKFFNNQTNAGKLLQGYDVANTRLINELETDTDLAVISAL